MIFGTKKNAKKHDLWHENKYYDFIYEWEYQKAPPKTRYLLRRRIPKNTIFGTRKNIKIYNLWYEEEY